MNRYLLLFIAFLSVGQAAWSQSPLSYQLAPSNKSLYKIIYPVATGNGLNISVPFSSLVIHDIRPDTTKLGFYRSTKDRHSYKYRFTGNTAQELTAYLTAHYNKNLTLGSPNQLEIFVKKLWLSEFDSAELNLHNTHLRNAWLHVKAEVYLRTPAAYHPVFRIDSILYARKQNGYTSGGFITQMLVDALQRLEQADFSQIVSRKTLSPSQVDAYNKHTTTTPSAHVPVKGIYSSFTDFKKGKPSATEYEVRFETLTDIVYVKEQDGNTYARKDIWGFSDGQTVFIRMGSNFFPLYNHQNTWEFYGTAAMEFKAPRMPVLAGAGWPFLLAAAGATEITQYEKRLINLRAFQVDVENGKFY
ncbi:hypothetical protein [Paraflavitalea pollutisoli]|uniref:hypothetical protein n=1 Tax=Paraflavitalea pollutisoli TaxID=3034143 RepID=UPI0023ED2B8F|nr:hypothetical protein [Paraflavitalea sp. H1-2-19X]